MKFWMSYPMPWPHLPNDFAEKYDTAWVTSPNTLFDPERGPEAYQSYSNQLAYADELGSDGVVLNEHRQNPYGVRPSQISLPPHFQPTRLEAHSAFCRLDSPCTQ